MHFLRNILLRVFILRLSLIFFTSCSYGRDYELIQSHSFDAWKVSIQTERNWEYSRPFYYSISRDGQLLSGPTFIELDQADRVEVELSHGFIYGVSCTVNHVVFFVYRIGDGVHWPGGDKANKDMLIENLRVRTGNSKLKAISDVPGYYLKVN